MDNNIKVGIAHFYYYANQRDEIFRLTAKTFKHETSNNNTPPTINVADIAGGSISGKNSMNIFMYMSRTTNKIMNANMSTATLRPIVRT